MQSDNSSDDEDDIDLQEDDFASSDVYSEEPTASTSMSSQNIFKGM